MKKAFTTLVLLAIMAITATAQAPTTATQDASIGPVVLKPESYAELDKMQEALAKAKEAEAAAQSNYEAKAAMRIATEQAMQVSILKALMAVGVTDPAREIAAPPKPEPAKAP